MHNTRTLDTLAEAVIDLMSLLNSPKRDQMLLREANVSLDRALFPILIALGARGPLGVAELADLVGRDHTTVSRQIAKLENLDLVARREGASDRRKNLARVTSGGKKIVQAITNARRRLLAKALANWSEAERKNLALQIRRFADALMEFREQG